MTFEEWQSQQRTKAEAVQRETGWDLPEGWAIGPVGWHRDSDALEESNWHVALATMSEHPETLGEFEANEDIDIAHFRHWAVGWVEEITFRMGSKAAHIAYDLAQRLENYPVLDEEAYSEREWEADHPGDGYCYSQYCQQEERCPTGAEFA